VSFGDGTRYSGIKIELLRDPGLLLLSFAWPSSG
jgi:hypothetical protein